MFVKLNLSAIQQLLKLKKNIINYVSFTENFNFFIILFEII